MDGWTDDLRLKSGAWDRRAGGDTRGEKEAAAKYLT